MNPRILIVEDDTITAEDLCDVLNELGYTVSGVLSNGADAIAQAQAEPPDLALMDIRIQGRMDGLDTAVVLREKFDIPVIFLTADAGRETVERANAAKALGYITKPFKQAELHANIEIALHKHRCEVRSKEREELLSATLGAMNVATIAFNREANVTFLNPAAEEWTGWQSNEAIGRPVEEVFSVCDECTSERVDTLLPTVLGTGNLLELRKNIMLLHRTGTSRPIEGSIAPTRDHHDKVSGAVIVFADRDGCSHSIGSAGTSPDSLREGDDLEFGTFKMVMASPPMKKVVTFARRVATSEASTILLEGESGTGKDVMAHFMHHFGGRHDRPFVALNCAAIPETLLESELFGYERGAFTDARAQKLGILELASEGTIFLDEIGEMPIVVQAKMLRALEEHTFRRLGGVRDIHVDLRVIAASNRNLSDAVKQGKFRLDLYYRLNVIQILLPPLRERREDILPLAICFVQHYNQRFNRKMEGLATGAVVALQNYDWPGNVRELRNVIERAVLLEESDWVQGSNLRLESDTRSDSSNGVKAASCKAGPIATLPETQKRILIEALDKADWNQSLAGKMLGVTRDTMRSRMKKFNLLRRGASQAR